MPIYSFTCCEGHTREHIFPRMEIPALFPCPECGGRAYHDIAADHRSRKPRFQTYFDSGLGRRVSSAAEIDRFAEERGCVAAGPNDRHYTKRKVTSSERLADIKRQAKWKS